jgi:hypothetical protein
VLSDLLGAIRVDQTMCTGSIHGLAHILDLATIALPRSEITIQRPAKQFQQDLEADACQSRIIAAFAQLVANESVLSPRHLVEAEGRACVVEGLADEVAALGWDVVVSFAEDLGFC